MFPNSEDWFFQQDNAPCHTGRSIKVWMEDHQIKTLSWRAQSPDLNPIENLWNVIKRKMDGHKPSNKAELLEFLRQEWHKVTQHQCERLVESMPRRMKAVLENHFTVIRVLLGLFFTLTGAVKLTDQISEDVYKQMRSQFVQFAEVFPLHDLGVQPDPLLYLQVTGWVELLAGLLLAFGPRLLQTLSNLVLSVIMIGALFTLIKLGEPLSMCTPATVCLGLLLLLILRGSGPRGRRVKAD